ncbi:hypothetical protein KY290_008953 [Solanum tuberosum]|uniref:Uncharacterized protein n=1 Tax=Solanum tuberosum TaxID=4113 RepID=A0ABQ7WCJ6_SOLTU|nr:hypothetical protein KY289_009327 [Solanum tuberosum]KAH0716018.1 hypothetical protein KY284_008923 [Solanum tuberosum]KAH0777542.1 hypothetical protein KY290_008953 [Solanum tuberosum]
MQVDPDMVQQFEDAGLSFTGKDESDRHMEIYSLVRLWTETDAEERMICFTCNWANWYGQYRGLDPWDVYSSVLLVIGQTGMASIGDLIHGMFIVQKLSAGELPQQSSHQCDQSSTSSCGDGFFCDERPSVKRELVNIWNSKLRNLKGSAHVHAMGSEKKNSAGTENLNNQYTVLNVTSGVLHFVGDSMVPDTIDKNFPEGAKVLQ